MQFFYKISASLTTRALKRTEKLINKEIEKQYYWAFNYFNSYWLIDFDKFVSDFKHKYKVKSIQVDSFLYKQLKLQYVAYKVYLTFDIERSYESYMNCLNDLSKDNDFIKDLGK